ncbi:MAG TPA: rhodanese-related sulfurtransferase [Rhabdochlamydiaceae bacterium]
MNSQYHILAYYLFTEIKDPASEVARHLEFIRQRDVNCRVYISEEGINGQMSAAAHDAQAYCQWLMSDPRFKDIAFKVQTHGEHVFPRATVKYRKQLVALDEKVDLALAGEKLSPDRWSAMLQQRDEKTLLLDVRNDYEWEIGHFEGAELPKLDAFREFRTYAQRLKEERDPKETNVMMYCTGGIRCELYSALLKKEGFENVFQLEGGVINYGQKEGTKHWKGKLFVFDDRLAVPISEEGSSEVISRCLHCDQNTDVYYNCSNMDCNALFLCCPQCARAFAGCCCKECQSAPRIRSYEEGARPKPFRRAYHYSTATG